MYDVFQGDGIIKLKNGLTIYGNFNNGQLKDTVAQIRYVNGDTYCGNHKNGIKSGEGVYKYHQTGVEYIGEWLDNKRHGKGQLIYHKDNKAKFVGMFKVGELVEGEYQDPIGNIFKSMKHPDAAKTGDASMNGRFYKGRLCGYGKVEYVGGDTYIGMFKDGKRSGHGQMIFNQYSDIIMDYQKCLFEGDWKFNKRNGYGVMTWPDNSRFEGEWSNDCRTKGKLFMPDHNEYQGSFRNDKLHGIGKIIYDREGIVFEGIFENGLASSIGKLTYKNSKQVYIGEIEELKRQGIGILIDQVTHTRYEGQFEDDVPLGDGKIMYKNGDIYTGKVDKMIKQGPGKLEYKLNRKVFYGQFDKDLREGLGYLFKPDGKVYCGQFRQDNEEGVGEYLNCTSHAVETVYKSVDMTKIEMIQDKLYKICSQLKVLGGINIS